MKKLLLSIYIILLCFTLSAATMYTVETSRGPQEVVIPDGYTELDVLLKVAQAYYELNYSFEDVTKQVSILETDVKTYIEEGQKLRQEYENLNLEYKLLVEKYTELTKTTFLQGIIGLSVGYYDKTFYPAISVGAELLERLDLITSLSFINSKVSVSLGFSYKF